MVCIAAFIILAVLALAVPLIRLFSRRLADQIMTLFRRSTHCFTRRITLRTCDTTFAEDVKGTVLRRVVLRHPNWVKPLSALMELLSALIVLTTIWSVLVGAKSLVSLYVYGTCNPTTPSSCSLDGSEACTIDAVPVAFNEHPVRWIGGWFGEFGEAIMAIPTKLKYWEARDYLPSRVSYYDDYDQNKPTALDIIDPGCTVCANSFKKQLARGFFKKYNVAILPYPIKDGRGGYKFPNSYLATQYLVAVQLKPLKKSGQPMIWRMIKRMYTGKTADGDSNQNAFNVAYDQAKAERVLKDWLRDFGYSDQQLEEIAKLARSDQVAKIIEDNTCLVNDKVKTKKIPTEIFAGQRHDGGFDDATKF